ncbi:MAG: hypothetical protein AAGA93_01205 [Actinomycetota bacterium]
MTIKRDERIGSAPEQPTPPTQAGAADGQEPPDPSAEADLLRRQLRRERERSLNATDRVLGAQAEAAQARAEIKELRYMLHVRNAELAELAGQLEQARATMGAPSAAQVGEWAKRAPDTARRLVQRVRG